MPVTQDVEMPRPDAQDRGRIHSHDIMKFSGSERGRLVKENQRFGHDVICLSLDQQVDRRDLVSASNFD